MTIDQKKKTGLFQAMNYIDYPSNFNGKVCIDMSFTYMHWKVAEGLEQEDSKMTFD